MTVEEKVKWSKREMSHDAVFPGRPVLLEDVHVGISINVLLVSKREGSWNLTKPSHSGLRSHNKTSVCFLGRDRRPELGHLSDLAPIQPQGHLATPPDLVLPHQTGTLMHNCEATLTGAAEPFDSSAVSNRRYYEVKSI